MQSIKIKLGFLSVVKLSLLWGLCTGIVWMLLLLFAILLGIFPSEPPPWLAVLLIPFGCSLLFGGHIAIGYPLYLLFNKFTLGINVNNYGTGN